MSALESSPAEVVDRLFARLSATYGAAWTRQWADVPVADVKTAWGHELAGYVATKAGVKVIAHALDNLPERCPNAIQFKNLCRAAPAADVPRLDAPKADMARVAEELAKLAPVRAQPLASGKDWAHRIMARKAAGENINRFTLTCAQSALGMAA